MLELLILSSELIIIKDFPVYEWRLYRSEKLFIKQVNKMIMNKTWIYILKADWNYKKCQHAIRLCNPTVVICYMIFPISYQIYCN